MAIDRDRQLEASRRIQFAERRHGLGDWFRWVGTPAVGAGPDLERTFLRRDDGGVHRVTRQEAEVSADAPGQEIGVVGDPGRER